ncbi:DNA protecting protein DprA [Methylacidimicrobium sp. AP8]|uniref:DNA-processing protein DprA n=1 Tax=Methylacidimicrobium sp. AP8 TaxID=2730359 RepID=UPI0018C05A25|nr:DNA-processing protein DprA [Methylacidimicrobium sp. AP8]CAB4243277.1 DNA protecting protein DprA [Methylacidimicrobium sp. AP8]
MTHREAALLLHLLPGIGPARARRLTQAFGSTEAVFTAKEAELARLPGIGPKLAAEIVRADPARAQKEAARCRDQGIALLFLGEPGYPEALAEIPDPPLLLYLRGKRPERWLRGVAVVGSRRTSVYGIEAARRLSYQLAYSGIPVISGLARGIDTAAHMGALAAQGTTWAVLGSGIDRLYPPENEALARRIEQSGCLLSELPLGTAPARHTFPQRNRILSGLSSGVLVVEAPSASGALLTAQCALEQGRQVFAVPGRIDNPLAAGSNRLIQQGAKLVMDAGDIASELALWLPSVPATGERPLPSSLSEEERAVFTALGLEESPFDAIVARTGLPSPTVSSTLLRLELKRLVRRLPGNVFVRVA